MFRFLGLWEMFLKLFGGGGKSALLVHHESKNGSQRGTISRPAAFSAMRRSPLRRRLPLTAPGDRQGAFMLPANGRGPAALPFLPALAADRERHGVLRGPAGWLKACC